MAILFWRSCKLTLFGSVITRKSFHVKGHSAVFQIFVQVRGQVSIMTSPLAWTNSAGMLSTPVEFLIFSAFTAASTTARRIG